MRDAFVRTLDELALEDRRVCALTADLGLDLFTEFERRAPGRFLNVGIAEQTLIGVAAGLAYAGKVPFAYSIIPFVTSRPHDQVRVDVALAHANVKLVGVGAGFAYGYLGPTHHAVEDVALMRALPGLTVLTPGDAREAAEATRAAAATEGPVYLRLGKNGERDRLPGDGEPFAVGRARWLARGADVTLASSGTALDVTLAAAELLANRGVSAGVLHFGTVKPLDVAAVEDALRAAPLVAAIEEHTVVGGFGSAVAEAMAESDLPGRLVRLGVPDRFPELVGDRDFLLRQAGLDPASIADAVLARVRRLRAA
jgi:transketolase